MLFKWSLFTFNAIFLVLCSSLSKLWKESRLIRYLVAPSFLSPTALDSTTHFKPLRQQLLEKGIARFFLVPIPFQAYWRIKIWQSNMYKYFYVNHIIVLNFLILSSFNWLRFWFSEKSEEKGRGLAWDLWNSIRMKNKLHAKMVGCSDDLYFFWKRKRLLVGCMLV